MIKLPVHKSLEKDSAYFYGIFDADGSGIANGVYEEKADQIVSALNAQPNCKTCNDIGYVGPFKLGYAAELCPNAQQPKCETCGGSGIAKQQEDGGVAELFCDCPIGEEKMEAFFKDNPDCRPIQQPAGELVKKLQVLLGDIRGVKQLPLVFASQEDADLLEQAAVRIEGDQDYLAGAAKKQIELIEKLAVANAKSKQAAARIVALEKACGLAYEGLCTNDADACDNAILFIDKIVPAKKAALKAKE